MSDGTIRLDRAYLRHRKLLDLIATHGHRAAWIHLEVLALCAHLDNGGVLTRQQLATLDVDDAILERMVELKLLDAMASDETFYVHEWKDHKRRERFAERKQREELNRRNLTALRVRRHRAKVKRQQREAEAEGAETSQEKRYMSVTRPVRNLTNDDCDDERYTESPAIPYSQYVSETGERYFERYLPRGRARAVEVGQPVGLSLDHAAGEKPPTRANQGAAAFGSAAPVSSVANPEPSPEPSASANRGRISVKRTVRCQGCGGPASPGPLCPSCVEAGPA